MITLFKPKAYSGASDLRPQEEKDRDYKFEELVAQANNPDWDNGYELGNYPIHNQGNSGACVAFTTAKMGGIMLSKLNNNRYINLSPAHVYKRRINAPGGGMIGVDAGDIAKKGITLEDLVPSEKKSDREIDAIVIDPYKEKVGEVFKLGNYIQPPIKDIDTIASIIETTGKPVMSWFYFTHSEWKRTEPKIQDKTLLVYETRTSRHSVTVVGFIKKNGVKYLIIEDSWGIESGDKGRRYISEEFFKQRNFFNMYFMNFQFEKGEVSNKPKYNFTQTLKYDPKKPIIYNQPDVVALQDCLRWYGTFPANSKSTGYYGTVTQKAVRDFQAKEGIGIDGIVGPITRSKLNAIFNQ